MPRGVLLVLALCWAGVVTSPVNAGILGKAENAGNSASKTVSNAANSAAQAAAAAAAAQQAAAQAAAQLAAAAQAAVQQAEAAVNSAVNSANQALSQVESKVTAAGQQQDRVSSQLATLQSNLANLGADINQQTSLANVQQQAATASGVTAACYPAVSSALTDLAQATGNAQTADVQMANALAVVVQAMTSANDAYNDLRSGATLELDAIQAVIHMINTCEVSSNTCNTIPLSSWTQITGSGHRKLLGANGITNKQAQTLIAQQLVNMAMSNTQQGNTESGLQTSKAALLNLMNSLQAEITGMVTQAEQLFQLAQQMYCLFRASTVTINCAPSLTTVLNDLINAAQDQINSVTTALSAMQQLYSGISQVIVAYPGFQTTTTQEINALTSLNNAYGTC